MADTEDIAKVLTDYIVDSEYLNMHIPSIQSKMEDIVNWLMPVTSIGAARDFVRKMKAWNEDTEAQEETRSMDA